MRCLSCNTDNEPGLSACEVCGAALEAAPAGALADLLQPGTKLHDDAYRIGKVLGRGGFGITYQAMNPLTGEQVAIKEFFPDGCQRQGEAIMPTRLEAENYRNYLDKFLEEARTLSKFKHENIVAVKDSFEANGTAYMVMEYLDGRTLKEKLDSDGRMDETDAVALIKKVAEALQVIHQKQILHRDIKPSNIMLTGDGRIALIDFGTAREFIAEQTKTMTQMITPGYAPLEQRSAQGKFGPFTDIYALGATLYSLLTGAVPVDALDRIQGVELKAPKRLNPEISLGVSNAVMQAMSIKADDRPKNIKEFRRMLIRRQTEDSADAQNPAAPASSGQSSWSPTASAQDKSAPGATTVPAIPSWQRASDLRSNIQQSLADTTMAAPGSGASTQPPSFSISSDTASTDEGFFEKPFVKFVGAVLLLAVVGVAGFFSYKLVVGLSDSESPVLALNPGGAGDAAAADIGCLNSFWAESLAFEARPKGFPDEHLVNNVTVNTESNRHLGSDWIHDIEFTLRLEMSQKRGATTYDNTHTNSDGDVDKEITKQYYEGWVDYIVDMNIGNSSTGHVEESLLRIDEDNSFTRLLEAKDEKWDDINSPGVTLENWHVSDHKPRSLFMQIACADAAGECRYTIEINLDEVSEGRMTSGGLKDKSTFSRTVPYTENGKTKTRIVDVTQEYHELYEVDYPKGPIRINVWNEEALNLCEKYLAAYDADARVTRFEAVTLDETNDDASSRLLGMCKDLSAKAQSWNIHGVGDLKEYAGFNGLSSKGEAYLVRLDGRLDSIETLVDDYTDLVPEDGAGIEQCKLGDYLGGLLLDEYRETWEGIYYVYCRDRILDHKVYPGLSEHLAFIRAAWPTEEKWFCDTALKYQNENDKNWKH